MPNGSKFIIFNKLGVNFLFLSLGGFDDIFNFIFHANVLDFRLLAILRASLMETVQLAVLSKGLNIRAGRVKSFNFAKSSLHWYSLLPGEIVL